MKIEPVSGVKPKNNLLNEDKFMSIRTLTEPTITIEPELCKGCGLCIEACPPDVLKFHEKFNSKGYHYAYYLGENCTGCGVLLCLPGTRSDSGLQKRRRS